MSGDILDYKKHLSLQIGKYCQVHEDITGHDGFWAKSVINSTLHWEEIEQFYCLEQNVCSQ